MVFTYSCHNDKHENFNELYCKIVCLNSLTTEMSNFKAPADLCDVVSVAVLCEHDSTMMVTVESFEHWIPYVKIQSGQAWERAISKEVQEVNVYIFLNF